MKLKLIKTSRVVLFTSFGLDTWKRSELLSDLSMPNLPSGWFEYVDDTSGKPYYYHQASNVTTWERPAAPNTRRAPQVKPNEATQSSESSGSLPGGLLSQIQVSKVCY